MSRVINAEKAVAARRQQEESQNVGLTLAKRLAHNEKVVRDKSMKTLRAWMIRRKEITEFDMLKIWKGLFYCTLTHNTHTRAHAHVRSHTRTHTHTHTHKKTHARTHSHTYTHSTYIYTCGCSRFLDVGQNSCSARAGRPNWSYCALPASGESVPFCGRYHENDDE